MFFYTVVSNLLGLTRFGLRSVTGRIAGERGQDLIEYALLGGIIAAALITVGITAYTGALNSMGAGIGACIDFNKTTTCDPLP